MNVLSIQISAANEYGLRKAVLHIDGRELLDLVREVEEPIAVEAGEANLAGAYDYPSPTKVLYPSRQLLGEPINGLSSYNGRVSILECDCGCEGCWPLTMDVVVTNDRVIWQDFQQVHRQNWKYPQHFAFIFDRSQLENALKIDDDAASIRDVP
jgi:hypothetical protein